ncbi:MAG TPA: hypothetical protein VGE08_18465 [Steroidobacter sp.]
MDACVKSFIESNFAEDRVVHVRKRPKATMYPQSKYTIALKARGARSGEVLAQARCVAGSRGNVIVLDSPPFDNLLANADFKVTTGR